MEICIRIDTNAPPSSEQLRSEANWLLHVADNREEFFKNAPSAASVFSQHTIASHTHAGSDPADNPSAGTDVAVVTGQVPPPPPPAANTQVPAPQKDTRGFPWDARIHSSTKALLANGAWKYKRGTTDSYIADVERQLNQAAVMAHVEADRATTIATATAGTVPPPPPADVPPPPPAANVPPPPGATTQVPPPPPPGATQTGAVNPITAISAIVGAGKVSATDILAQCNLYGCAHMGELANNPAAAQAIYNTLVAQGFAN